MVIKAFTYILLIVAIGVYFIPIDKVDSNLDEKDIPLVTFNDSTMYT